jgi:hypothetical protein
VQYECYFVMLESEITIVFIPQSVRITGNLPRETDINLMVNTNHLLIIKHSYLKQKTIPIQRKTIHIRTYNRYIYRKTFTLQ